MELKSWNNDESLRLLAEKSRNREIVEGVVRTVETMKIPVVRGNGDIEHVEEETLVVVLPGGVTGYCPASEFRERDFKSLGGFVGSKQGFVITRIELDQKMALLSEKQASARKRNSFFDELDYLKAEGKLESETYEAVVSGYNRERGIVYARLNGHDCFIYRRDWFWSQSGTPVVDAAQGEKIQVKVVRFDREGERIQLSRKHAMVDPFDYISTLKEQQRIAGRVVNIHPVHGLFVEVENGVVLKASKISRIPEPEIGEVVNCVVQRINPDERKGKVLIIDYPQGKRRRQDLGSFLFD